MDPAAAISLVAATLNLSAALALAVVSTAPGWRSARAFAAIALTAGLYSVTSVVFCVDGLPTSAYLAVSRATYFLGHLHSLIWLALAFGGPDASWSQMPRGLRAYSAASAAVAIVFAATGIHLLPLVETISIPWAGVQYHYPVASALGEAYGIAVLLQFSVTFFALLWRYARGERGLRLQILGFALFFAFVVVELLVANRTIEFLSPADAGMLCIVLPVSVRVMRRFVADAEQLNEWTGQLAGEVREQTEWRGRAQAALVESERMAAIGRMAAGVGHEINNPLTYLQLSLGEVESYLRSTGAPEGVVASIGHATDGATRIQRVAERLRNYSRRHEEREPVDLRDVVAAAVKVAGPSLTPDIRVTFDLPETARVVGDEPRLVQAVLNVLVNAAQAVKERPGAGSIHVETGSTPAQEAVVSVHDDGPGVEESTRARMGEPYFTTRADAGGLGLGLFVTRGIVDAHGGHLHVESAVGEGTTVRLVFPGLRESRTEQKGPVAPPERLTEKAAVAPPVASAPAAKPPTSLRLVPPAVPTTGDRPKVLIVDDEPLILTLLAAILRNTWDVTLASSGADALAHLAAGRFNAIVCDLMMPGMSGIELSDVISRKDPEHRRRMVFLTGGAVTEDAESFLARADVRHLTKPISRVDLHAALDEIRQLS